MKILFLAPQPFFVERGTPIAVRLAVESLCRAGHRVDLLTFHEGKDIAIPGMTLHRISPPPGAANVPIGFSPKKLICDLWLAAAACRLVRRGDYDVVHAVEEAVFIGLFLKLLGRFKLVYDMDSLLPDQIGEKWPAARPLLPALRWFEAQAVRRSDLVLGVCRHIVDRAAALTDPARVHWTPDVAFTGSPAGTPDMLRSCFDEDRPLALYAGNLETYQGVGLLLEALERVPADRRCNLAVLGGDPGRIRSFTELARDRGLARHVAFIGPRPLDDLPAYLAQADILCSPRLKGVNTPMKIYSYLAAGKAILATDIASHQQVLDSHCAVMVAPTVEAMAGGLDRLAGDPALRTRLGHAASERSGEHYSLPMFDRRMHDAYRVIGVAPLRESAA